MQLCHVSGPYSPSRPRIDPRPNRVAVNMVAMGQMFLKLQRFYRLSSFDQCSILHLSPKVDDVSN